MMKVFSRLLSVLFAAGLMIFLSNCGGDDPKPSAQQTELGKLTKTWNIASATLDGNTRTSDFTGFSLTISGTFNSSSPDGPYNYSVSGKRPTPSPWPASGTWAFVNIASEVSLQRIEDSVPMKYTINSSGQLTLELTCASCAYPGARVEQVNGTWVFVLN